MISTVDEVECKSPSWSSLVNLVNDKQVTVLVGLDLSAAFDTVSHDTLLQRLQTEFGVTERA